jgi:hypothetical protein
MPSQHTYLTLDLDWADDAVIADSLDLLNASGAKATWFVTHATSLLDEIRSGGHELGLHPNFNQLLGGEKGQARDVLLRTRDLVPDARSVRSHSILRSSRLSAEFKAAGLSHESNVLIPPAAGPRISAWRDWIGLVQVPIRWEDDIRLIDDSLQEPDSLIGAISPLVLNFHPIHIYLNSLRIEDYEDSRVDHKNFRALLARRRPSGSGGTRDRLIALLAALGQVGTRARLISECVPHDENGRAPESPGRLAD